MSNKRKEIRNAFLSLLKGRTRAHNSVFTSRTRTIWDEHLPAINVWAGDEEPEPSGEAPYRYKRVLEIVIELYLQSVYEIDDDMDDFMAEVEAVINSEDLFSLSETVDQIIYASSHIELQGESAKEGAVATIKYNVVYYTYAGVDSSLLPDLQGLDASWDTVDFTKDTIELPTT